LIAASTFDPSPFSFSGKSHAAPFTPPMPNEITPTSSRSDSALIAASAHCSPQ
jgi:hypothetical protein